MKKSWKSITLIVIILCAVAYMTFNFFLTGNDIPYYSCGPSFSNQFKEAVLSDNPNFCSTFNEALPQFKNLYGLYSCVTPKIGFMEGAQAIGQKSGPKYFKRDCLNAMMEATNKADYCLLLDESVLQDFCIGRLAFKTQNKTLCELMKDKSSINYQVCLG